MAGLASWIGGLLDWLAEAVGGDIVPYYVHRSVWAGILKHLMKKRHLFKSVFDTALFKVKFPTNAKKFVSSGVPIEVIEKTLNSVIADHYFRPIFHKQSFIRHFETMFFGFDEGFGQGLGTVKMSASNSNHEINSEGCAGPVLLQRVVHYSYENYRVFTETLHIEVQFLPKPETLPGWFNIFKEEILKTGRVPSFMPRAISLEKGEGLQAECCQPYIWFDFCLKHFDSGETIVRRDSVDLGGGFVSSGSADCRVDSPGGASKGREASLNPAA